MFWLCALVFWGAVQISYSVDNQMLALVTELQGSHQKKSLDLFPDTLDVEVETDEGREVLHLVKQKSMNVRTIPVEYDDPNINKKSFALKKAVAYYQDLDNMVPLKVEAALDAGVVKRTLTGTMLHKQRAYELHPGSGGLQSSAARLLQERGLGSEHQHRIHVLKEVDLRDYLRPNEMPVIPDLERQKQEFKQQQREEQTMKDFLRIVSTDVKSSKSVRTKRYASHSTNVFHIEMAFVVDYSVYAFWMDKHNDDQNKVHETILHYYTQIFNGIHMSFRRIDFDKHGIAIVLWLSGIHVVTKPENEIAKVQYANQAGASDTFSNLGNFLRQKNLHWFSADHYMLWTKSDLAADFNPSSETYSVDVLGVAYLCYLCHPGEAVSINEDNGFFSWVTGAHEFGHGAGSEHDGTGSNTCAQDVVHIMYVSAYYLDGNIAETAFTFSDCSVAQFKQCFTGTGIFSNQWPLVCVYDTVCQHDVPVQLVDELAGKRYNLTEQCQLFIGPGSSPDQCSHLNTEICEQLYCHTDQGCEYKYSEFRAAPGTPCSGNSPNSVCNGNDCVCYEGRCMDSSDINTMQVEMNPSCSDVTYVPPQGCVDTGDAADCMSVVLNYPWECFKSDYYKEHCKASCYQYGLFYVENPPCPLPDGQTPAVSNTSPAIPALNKPLYCQTSEDIGSMTCPNHPDHCIPMYAFCDGESDCPDGADEQPDICIQVPCAKIVEGEEFLRCKGDPSTCFNMSAAFDGHQDCSDSSDEDSDWFIEAPRYCYDIYGGCYLFGMNCPNNPGLCIPGHWACDGDNDCAAMEGETGDESVEFCDIVQCRPGFIRCPNLGMSHKVQCIPWSYACDGEPDCEGGGDEHIDFCLSVGMPPTCDTDQLMCPGTEKFQCIPNDWPCDDVPDCDGGMDEDPDWCKTLPPANCHEDDFQCGHYKFRCIPQLWLCDSDDDCRDGSDEDATHCNSATKKQTMRKLKSKGRGKSPKKKTRNGKTLW